MWTVGGQDFPQLIRQSFPTVYNGTQHVISAHCIFVANSIDNRLIYPNLLRSKVWIPMCHPPTPTCTHTKMLVFGGNWIQLQYLLINVLRIRYCTMFYSRLCISAGEKLHFLRVMSLFPDLCQWVHKGLSHYLFQCLTWSCGSHS